MKNEVEERNAFRRLSVGEIVKEFNCGFQYKDLNDFILNEAHRDAIQFYFKNGFQLLTDDDVNDVTRLMYFDLMALKA